MKKLTGFGLILCIALNIHAQEVPQPEMPQQPLIDINVEKDVKIVKKNNWKERLNLFNFKQRRERVSVLKERKNRTGFYISQHYNYGRFNESNAVVLAARVGIIAKQRFAFGLTGNGIYSNRDQIGAKEDDVIVTGGYGGFFLSRFYSRSK